MISIAREVASGAGLLFDGGEQFCSHVCRTGQRETPHRTGRLFYLWVYHTQTVLSTECRHGCMCRVCDARPSRRLAVSAICTT